MAILLLWHNGWLELCVHWFSTLVKRSDPRLHGPVSNLQHTQHRMCAPSPVSVRMSTECAFEAWFTALTLSAAFAAAAQSWFIVDMLHRAALGITMLVMGIFGLIISGYCYLCFACVSLLLVPVLDVICAITTFVPLVAQWGKQRDVLFLENYKALRMPLQVGRLLQQESAGTGFAFSPDCLVADCHARCLSPCTGTASVAAASHPDGLHLGRSTCQRWMPCANSGASAEPGAGCDQCAGQGSVLCPAGSPAVRRAQQGQAADRPQASGAGAVAVPGSQPVRLVVSKVQLICLALCSVWVS